jgi:hypothetical protein
MVFWGETKQKSLFRHYYTDDEAEMECFCLRIANKVLRFVIFFSFESKIALDDEIKSIKHGSDRQILR